MYINNIKAPVYVHLYTSTLKSKQAIFVYSITTRRKITTVSEIRVIVKLLEMPLTLDEEGAGSYNS